MMAQKSFKMLAALAGMAVLAALPMPALAQDASDCPDLNPAVYREYSGSYALLIGVSKYDQEELWHPLPKVPEFLSDLEKALGCKGFNVKVVPDPPSSELRNELTNFITKHGATWSENRLLIYFMGHGKTFRNFNSGRISGYLVPSDAPRYNSSSKEEAEFKRKAIGMDEFALWARRVEAKHALFIFDSCYSAHAIPEEKNSMRSPNPEFAVQVITAGNGFEEVPANSIFTRWFLKAITTSHADADINGDGDLTVSELGAFLRQKMDTVSEWRQTPYTSRLDGSGDFVFYALMDNP